MSMFKRFEDAKHPDADTRGEAVQNVVSIDDPAYSMALKAALDVFELSECFLKRQYYHRDCALEALNNGDVAEALKHINMIGDSGHGFKV